MKMKYYYNPSQSSGITIIDTVIYIAVVSFLLTNTIAFIYQLYFDNIEVQQQVNELYEK